MARNPPSKLTVDTLKHDDKRKNIPTAQHQSALQKEQEAMTLKNEAGAA